MSIVLTFGHEEDMLEAKRAVLNTYTLRLYKNNYDPVRGMSAGDFVEANFPGYAPQALNDFGAVFTNALDKAETDSGVHTFLDTGSSPANDIYGWYATDSGGVVKMACKNPAGPVTLNAAGIPYSVKIDYTSTQE